MMLADLKTETYWRVTFIIAAVIGILVVILLGYSGASAGNLQRVMAGLILVAASTAVGIFLGFLFGIPRSQQNPVVNDAVEAGGLRSYQENTNLEQISDWLTKIIVGLTLVQFREIQSFIEDIGRSFGPAMINNTNPAISQAIAIATILYFLVIAFLFMYLWTRIYVESLFKRQSARLEKELSNMLSERAEITDNNDAIAIDLTDSFLDEKSNPEDDKYNDIEVKISKSSLIARTLIFEKARKVRKNSWESQNLQLLANTIPIFRGLVKAEPDKYHRNYGQLGYALIRAPEQDFPAAKIALEKAIELRGASSQTSGTGYYEFNLAIALINLDKKFKNGTKSVMESYDRISNLLNLSKKVIPDLNEPVISKWSKLNGYS